MGHGFSLKVLCSVAAQTHTGEKVRAYCQEGVVPWGQENAGCRGYCLPPVKAMFEQ